MSAIDSILITASPQENRAKLSLLVKLKHLSYVFHNSFLALKGISSIIEATIPVYMHTAFPTTEEGDISNYRFYFHKYSRNNRRCKYAREPEPSLNDIRISYNFDNVHSSI
jgi:hypothetical protein